MNDSYVECLVERDKNMSAAALRIAMYVLGGICILLAIGGIRFLFVVGIALILIGVFVCPPAEVEYEYLYIGKELSIDMIIAKSKRKTVATYDLNKMEVMCPANSHELDSYKNRKVQEKDFSSKKEGSKPYVIVYHDEKEESLVYFEPNDELFRAIKNVMPRKVLEY